MSSVRSPRSARQRAIVMAVVVLPTPPFWFPIMTFIISVEPPESAVNRLRSKAGSGSAGCAWVRKSVHRPAYGRAFWNLPPRSWLLENYGTPHCALYSYPYDYIYVKPSRSGRQGKTYDTEQVRGNSRGNL